MKTHSTCRPFALLASAACVAWIALPAMAEEPPATKQRTYQNRLTRLDNPRPILTDFPEFVQPVEDLTRYEAPVLIDDPGADLSVRGWRFSYNARGIIEVPNRLKAAKTAVVVVHPWGIDDGQGWTTPEPAGVAFGCTPEKNALMVKHAAAVINPFLKRLRGQVGLVLYSMPGTEDPIRKKLYRSTHGKPTESDRKQGAAELTAKLKSFTYRGGGLPEELQLTSGKPAVDYFNQFPGLDASPRFNNEGFWNLPIPVMRQIDVDPDDVVLYDTEGYPALKKFLEDRGIEHVLLCGYHADLCVCKTTAGHENLRRDFNVFLVGDAVQASLPANKSARYATNQTVSYASINLFITQASWVKKLADVKTAGQP